jgi:type VI secretion system protein VasG
MDFNVKTLIQKLNPTCKKALEEAAALCVSQTNYNVEVEHFLLRLLEDKDSDVIRALKYYEIPVEQIRNDLNGTIDTFRRGNNMTPGPFA